MSLTRKRGFYKQDVNKTAWELPKTYVSLTHVGSGAYGAVWSSGFWMSLPQPPPCATSMTCESGCRGFQDICRPYLPLGSNYLVMPFMQTDLQKIMGMEFSEDKIQYLVYQMLKGLKYIHSAGVIHRDLKPGNLAVNEDCELKILDFGLARHADAEMTGYVVTRWYRAPEVILSWMRYNQTVDIWSVGCIMAEMLTGKTLFKGKDYLDQLTQILKVTGVPGAEFVQKLNDKAVSGSWAQADQGQAKSYIQSLPQSPKKDFSQLFPRASPQAVDLLEKMLELDVDKRLTASQALTHPFFEPFRDPEEETEAQQPLDDSLEHEKLTVDEWKQHIYKEVVNFSPIARKDSRRRSGMKLQ
ncbi:mitogen-activated protein kinase 13 isoform X3 [Camelus dromedarius]|uniref:mitogen-activated protein kinase n=2 Tax=Camelus TaxID=9836 RepID=A0A8B8RLL2_CAMFR|nr:mitogen-activated protein kinase 13 isoform X3 [Camelus dromedarius]XP_032318828.1 mitogen-activated protein kinase 13 isoform X3 [Camelus ferus]XP_045368146.1 mitogen-activated protein kinase 13 isoform X3 [Camelus bactrianus]